MKKWLVYEFVEVFDSEEEANNFNICCCCCYAT